MNKKININIIKMMLVLCYCSFAFLVLFILKKLELVNYYDWLKIINFLVLCVLVIQIGFIKVFKYEIFSISGMFLIFSYVFHLSYQFLILINYDFGSMNYAIPTNRYGIEIFRNAVEYSLVSIIALFLGMILAMPRKSGLNFEHVKKNISSNFNKKLGIAIIIFALPVDIYLLMSRIKGMITGGYLGSIEVSNGSLALFITYLLLPGIFLYLTSIKGDIKKTRIVASIYILYKLIGTFTGLRAYTILQIILFVYLYFKTVEKPKIKTVVYGGIVSYLMLSWFIIIRNTRSTGIKISDLLEIFNAKNNVILNSLSEFGFTINVVCIAFQDKVQHIFGSQTFYSVIAIIPKVSEIFGQYSSYTIYNALDLSKYGSSFIADFYFDFGYWGIVACLVYGLLIQNISNYINKSLINGNYYKVALLLPLVIDILFSVRSGTYKLPRIFIWTGIMIVLIKYGLKLMEGKKYDIKKIH